jgi:hypothetical protein
LPAHASPLKGDRVMRRRSSKSMVVPPSERMDGSEGMKQCASSVRVVCKQCASSVRAVCKQCSRSASTSGARTRRANNNNNNNSPPSPPQMVAMIMMLR